MPTRTCIACRGESDREELVRLALSPAGETVVDYRGRLPGRGAWVHANASCIEGIEAKTGLLSRALRHKVSPEGLTALLRDAVLRAIRDGLSIASAGGDVIGGFDTLCAALQAADVVEVVVASDASQRTVDGLRRAAGEALVFTVIPLDREALGHQVGHPARAALGVVASKGSMHLRRQLRRWRDLG